MSRTINERLEELKNKLCDEKLINHSGLGNEVDFHIFDYDPEDEYIVRDVVDNVLLKENFQKNLIADYTIKRFDIYDLIIDVLDENDLLKSIFKNELKKGTDRINRDIQEIIGVGTKNNLIVDKIKNDIKDNQIIFITGVAKCFGIIRGHEILNNLQPVITKNPLIMFYPGTYTGQSMELFNRLEPVNYYRAFKIVSR